MRKNRDQKDHTVLSWHALPIEQVYETLRSDQNGLSREEAARRVEQYGKNTLPTRKAPGIAEIIFHQFRSPLIYILLVAGIISVLIGDVKDAGFIILVVVINAAIGVDPSAPGS